MSRILLLLIISFCTTSLMAQDDAFEVMISTTEGNIRCKLYNETPKHRNKFLEQAELGYYNGTLFYRVIEKFMIQGGSKDSRNAAPGARIGYGDPSFTVPDEILPNMYHKRGVLAAPRQPDEINPMKQSDISQFFIVQGRVYRETELDTMELAVNIPIKKKIKAKYMTPEVRAQLKTLKAEKKVAEFRAIAEPLKREMDTAFEVHPDRLVFNEEQRKIYTTVGGYPELDGQYTIFGEVVEGMDVVDRIAAMKTDKNDRPLKDVVIKVRMIR